MSVFSDKMRYRRMQNQCRFDFLNTTILPPIYFSLKRVFLENVLSLILYLIIPIRAIEHKRQHTVSLSCIGILHSPIFFVKYLNHTYYPQSFTPFAQVRYNKNAWIPLPHILWIARGAHIYVMSIFSDNGICL